MVKASTLALAPLSWLYSAATRIRLTLYRAGVRRVHKVGAPVISVGNLTAGGTGKTPFVAWLAGELARGGGGGGGGDEGRRVCILSRGYGRATAAHQRVVVSDGERILAGVREGGDEPFLLAKMLQSVAAVISDANRAAAANWACQHLASELFILDDGFQHFSVRRDLNIVLVDATDPWGGGHLLPRGRLREPRTNLARADCIIITRADQTNDLNNLRAEAERLSGGRAVFVSQVRTRRVRPLLPSAVDPAVAEEELRRHPVAAFCAIGNPQSFFAHLRSDGYTLNYTRAFPDHHIYTQSEADRLVSEAMANGARGLLTTAKDAVKLGALRFALPCYVIEIELVIEDEDRLLRIVQEAIQ